MTHQSNPETTGIAWERQLSGSNQNSGAHSIPSVAFTQFIFELPSSAMAGSWFDSTHTGHSSHIVFRTQSCRPQYTLLCGPSYRSAASSVLLPAKEGEQRFECQGACRNLGPAHIYMLLVTPAGARGPWCAGVLPEHGNTGYCRELQARLFYPVGFSL